MTSHFSNTIKKAIRGEQCGYKERHHQPFPVLGPYLAIIDGWLENDREAPKKQRHTALGVISRSEATRNLIAKQIVEDFSLRSK
jgi:hypothetical protein